VPHEVLNAQAERAGRESEIVAQAGRAFAITIATNMAGRGTDILLGGTPATYVSSCHCILLYMRPTLYTTVHVAGRGIDILLGGTPLHMRPRTTVYYCICVLMWPAKVLISFSAVHPYIRVLVPLYTTTYVSSCCCVCVRILVHVWPHTTVCVSSILLCVCPHTTMYVSSCYNVCVVMLLYVSSYYYMHTAPRQHELARQEAYARV
jgi:hypothetical protein